MTPPKSIEDAKNLAVNVTSGKLSLVQAKERVESLKRFRDNTSSEDEKSDWQQEIDKLLIWIESDAFQKGDFPQGIDDLVIDLIEWRAMIYAFTHAQTKVNPFDHHQFFSQWIVGAAYAVLSIIGKLNSNHHNDISLRSLWNTIKPFIEEEGIRSQEEIQYIDACLHREHGHFTKSRSKAILLRNTVIAHNEKSLQMSWDEIDPDIQILARIWGLIVSWCSFGIMFPFRSAEEMFAGLETIYDREDINALCSKRDEYIEGAKLWCKTHLHNNKIDLLPGPFTTISISINHNE